MFNKHNIYFIPITTSAQSSIISALSYGSKLSTDCKFCLSCGIKLIEEDNLEAKPIPAQEIRLPISTQGVDSNLNANGSYDSLKWGKLNVNEAIDAAKGLSVIYPKEILEMGEWCQINLLIDGKDSTLSFSLIDDYAFMVFEDNKTVL